jgi:hypothetical protein
MLQYFKQQKNHLMNHFGFKIFLLRAHVHFTWMYREKGLSASVLPDTLSNFCRVGQCSIAKTLHGEVVAGVRHEVGLGAVEGYSHVWKDRGCTNSFVVRNLWKIRGHTTRDTIRKVCAGKVLGFTLY